MVLYVLAYGSHLGHGLGRSVLNNPHCSLNYAFLIMHLLPDTRTSVLLYVRLGLPAVWIPNNYELCITHFICARLRLARVECVRAFRPLTILIKK